jgi:hypothetical protein
MRNLTTASGKNQELGCFGYVVMVKVKAAISGLYDTDACRHIVSLPVTEFTPSPEALHTKHA